MLNSVLIAHFPGIPALSFSSFEKCCKSVSAGRSQTHIQSRVLNKIWGNGDNLSRR
jgi:hypothetical protein